MLTSKIFNYKLSCDFCGEKKPFKHIRQVPLKIDKNSKSQNSFAYQCNDCETSGKKITVDNQRIKTFVGRSKAQNETSIFDDEEGSDE